LLQGGRGLIGYTKGAARDLAPRGISLNVVQAGLMQTYMGPPSPEALKVMVSALAIQRASEPAETAPEQNRRLPAAEAEIIVRMTPPVALGNSACPSVAMMPGLIEFEPGPALAPAMGCGSHPKVIGAQSTSVRAERQSANWSFDEVFVRCAGP
jgi:hypothetical protein